MQSHIPPIQRTSKCHTHGFPPIKKEERKATHKQTPRFSPPPPQKKKKERKKEKKAQNRQSKTNGTLSLLHPPTLSPPPQTENIRMKKEQTKKQDTLIQNAAPEWSELTRRSARRFSATRFEGQRGVHLDTAPGAGGLAAAPGDFLSGCIGGIRCKGRFFLRLFSGKFQGNLQDVKEPETGF